MAIAWDMYSRFSDRWWRSLKAELWDWIFLHRNSVVQCGGQCSGSWRKIAHGVVSQSTWVRLDLRHDWRRVSTWSIESVFFCYLRMFLCVVYYQNVCDDNRTCFVAQMLLSQQHVWQLKILWNLHVNNICKIVWSVLHGW